MSTPRSLTWWSRLSEKGQGKGWRPVGKRLVTTRRPCQETIEGLTKTGPQVITMTIFLTRKSRPPTESTTDRGPTLRAQEVLTVTTSSLTGSLCVRTVLRRRQTIRSLHGTGGVREATERLGTGASTGITGVKWSGEGLRVVEEDIG